MLQRAGKLKFETIQGTLTLSGEAFLLTDDSAQTYTLEAGRMGATKMDHLIGARVEVKGLVELEPNARIHVIYLKG